MIAGKAVRMALVAGALIAGTQPASAFDLPWAGKEKEAPVLPPRPVVTEVLAETAQNSRSVPGAIAAKTQVTLAFQTLGRLVNSDVDLGDQVTKDQPLAQLDPETLTGNVRAAEAGLDAAQVQLTTAQSTAERTRALARRDVATQAQLEQAEQALAAAQAAASQAQSELIRAQDAESFAEIRAPFDGVISAVYETAGAVVAAGAPIYQLSAQNESEAVIDLPEAAVSALPPDASFIVWQEGAAELETAATVDRIDPIADTATRTRRVHLSLADGHAFRLGALIRARLDAGRSQVLTLPEAAILTRDDVTHVWVVERPEAEGPGTVRLTTVKLGAILDGRILVTEGLKPSAEVVVRGVNSLTEGQQVGRRVDP